MSVQTRLTLVGSHLYCYHTPQSPIYSTKQVASVILIRFLPCARAKVRPLEVVVTSSVLLTVLLKRLLISCQCCLSQSEWRLPLAHSGETCAACRLESLFCCEALLEVHPVLRGVAKWLLLTPITFLLLETTCVCWVGFGYLPFCTELSCRHHERLARTCCKLY